LQYGEYILSYQDCRGCLVMIFISLSSRNALISVTV
jgi:hypothetical protein